MQTYAIHTYIHTPTCARIHIHTQTSKRTQKARFSRIRCHVLFHTNTLLYVHAHTYTHRHADKRICLLTDIHTYTHSHTHTRTHIAERASKARMSTPNCASCMTCAHKHTHIHTQHMYTHTYTNTHLVASFTSKNVTNYSKVRVSRTKCCDSWMTHSHTYTHIQTHTCTHTKTYVHVNIHLKASFKGKSVTNYVLCLMNSLVT